MIPRFRPQVGIVEIAKLIAQSSGAMGFYETQFAKEFVYPEVVWFPYARVASQAYLESLGEDRSEIAVCAFNCVALGNSIIAADKKPYFVDTETDGFNQDITQFQQAIERESTQAGIIVSQWGIPHADLHSNKPILYDYCLRGLDTSQPKLKREDAVLYSLGWGKPLTGLKGAVLCTHDLKKANQWRAWRDERLTKGHWLRDFIDLLALYIAFQPRIFGTIVKLGNKLPLKDRLSGQSASQGQLLPSDWNRVPSQGVFRLGEKRLLERQHSLEERNQQIKAYRELLDDVSEISLPPSYPWLSHYPIRSLRRNSLCTHLRSQGIFSSDKLFDLLLCDFPWIGNKQFLPMPNARGLTASTLHLPLYAGLEFKEQEQIANCIKTFLQTKKGLAHAA